MKVCVGVTDKKNNSFKVLGEYHTKTALTHEALWNVVEVPQLTGILQMTHKCLTNSPNS